jgi:hypothetical protein
LDGTGFYRIKSIGINGEIKYSNIVRVQIGNVKPSITISPNPVEGSFANLQFKDESKGKFNINLVSTDGKIIFTAAINHPGGNSAHTLELPAGIARGSYMLEIIDPNNQKQTQTLIVNTK